MPCIHWKDQQGMKPNILLYVYIHWRHTFLTLIFSPTVVVASLNVSNVTVTLSFCLTKIMQNYIESFWCLSFQLCCVVLKLSITYHIPPATFHWSWRLGRLWGITTSTCMSICSKAHPELKYPHPYNHSRLFPSQLQSWSPCLHVYESHSQS